MQASDGHAKTGHEKGDGLPSPTPRKLGVVTLSQDPSRVVGTPGEPPCLTAIPDGGVWPSSRVAVEHHCAPLPTGCGQHRRRQRRTTLHAKKRSRRLSATRATGILTADRELPGPA